MHDVAKSTTVRPPEKKRRWLRGIIFGLLGVLAFAALIFGLISLKIATLVIAIIILTSGLIICGLIAFRRFRSQRATGGAVFSVLALFFLLGDLKTFQFVAMTAAGKKMVPPP